MRRLTASTAIVLAGLATAPLPAIAERLITSLSNHRIFVTSNFVGDTLVLFGAIEQDRASRPRSTGYDIVVTVTGPKRTVVTRRKERRLGIWVNVESREFVGAPLFYAALSNRPLEEIANEETRQRLQLGLRYAPLPQRIDNRVAEGAPGDAFRQAFVRISSRQGLYQESANAVTMLSPALFRAAIALPAGSPIGSYSVDVKLLADGAMIARTGSAFEVVKAGFEQFIAEAAHQQPVLYGLATALMALLTGWLASVIFRRD
jgi:uncharacterized protein (TIGR02186 family)